MCGDVARALLVELEPPKVERRFALLLNPVILEDGAFTHRDFGHGIGEVNPFGGQALRPCCPEKRRCVRSHVPLNDSGLAFSPGNNQVAGIGNRGKPACLGNVEQVNGLVKNYPLGDLEEYPVLEEGRIQCHKRMLPVIRSVAGQVAFQNFPITRQGFRQAAGLGALGESFQRRKLFRETPIDEDELGASEVAEGKLADSLGQRCSGLSAHFAGALEWHGGYWCDVGVSPLFLACGREPLLSKTLNGRPADFMQPGRRAGSKALLELIKARKVNAFFFF
jgi:hypothetical protein